MRRIRQAVRTLQRLRRALTSAKVEILAIASLLEEIVIRVLAFSLAAYGAWTAVSQIINHH